jgi:opacity protein-like surface antigen
LEPGYNFLTAGSFTLGGEFETGIIYNDLHIAAASPYPSTTRAGYSQVPFLANLVLKVRAGSRVVPYIGVGAGGDFSEAAFHTPGHWHHYTISDETDSAAQGLAGVRFRLNSFSEAGLGYKFLEAFPGGGRDVDTHAVEAFITIKF